MINFDDGYNGWANWYTWNVYSNLLDDEKLGSLLTTAASVSVAFLVATFKAFTYQECCDVYKIYDTWTSREIAKVDWEEIYLALRANKK